MLHRSCHLAFDRLAAEGRHVEFRDDVFVRLHRTNQLSDATVVVTQLVVHDRAVDHLQCLRQVRFARPFALAGHFTLRLTEDLQEVVIGRGIGQFRGTCSDRQAGEAFGNIGHGADRVEQLFGRQQTGGAV